MEKAENVLKAASDLFTQYGIRSVTMDQIARRAGVSKKSIYERFSDKEDLLVALVRQHFDASLEYFSEISQSGENPMLKTARFYEYLLRQQRSYHPSIYWTMARSYQKSIDTVDKYLHEISFELLPQLLNEACAKKLVREGINIPIISELYNWFLHRLVAGDFYELLNRDYKAVVESVVVQPLKGMLEEKHDDLLTDFEPSF